MNFTSTRPKVYDTWTISRYLLPPRSKIKDDSVVAHEIDGTTELPLYLGRIGPTRLGCHSEPGTNGFMRALKGVRIKSDRLEAAFEEDDQAGEDKCAGLAPLRKRPV